MAPEVLENDGYSKAADVYSFGILMHEVYTGKEPYSEFDFKKPWRNRKKTSFNNYFKSIIIINLIEISEHVISGGVKTKQQK